jgi:hypothetical protein
MRKFILVQLIAGLIGFAFSGCAGPMNPMGGQLIGEQAAIDQALKSSIEATCLQIFRTNTAKQFGS